MIIRALIVFLAYSLTLYPQPNPHSLDEKTIIDSVWDFSFSVPNRYFSNRSDLYKYGVLVGPKEESLEGFLYTVTTSKWHFEGFPFNEIPKFTDSSDTAKEIMLSIVNLVQHEHTAESYVEIHTDSITECHTDYGLRAFVIYKTENVGYNSGNSNVFHDDPYYVIVLPIKDDLAFLTFYTDWNIVKTIRQLIK